MSQPNPKGSAFYSGATRYGGSAANAKRREAARKAFFTFKDPQMTSKGFTSNTAASGSTSVASRLSMFNVPDPVSTYTINSNSIIRKEPPMPQLTTQAKKIFSWIQENSYAQQETFQPTKRTNLKKHRFNPMAYRAPVHKPPPQNKQYLSQPGITALPPAPTTTVTSSPLPLFTIASPSSIFNTSSVTVKEATTTNPTVTDAPPIKPTPSIKPIPPANPKTPSLIFGEINNKTGIKPLAASPKISLPNGLNPSSTPSRFAPPKFCGPKESVAPVFVLSKSFAPSKDLAIKATPLQLVEPKKDQSISSPDITTVLKSSPLPLFAPTVIKETPITNISKINPGITTPPSAPTTTVISSPLPQSTPASPSSIFNTSSVTVKEVTTTSPSLINATPIKSSPPIKPTPPIKSTPSIKPIHPANPKTPSLIFGEINNKTGIKPLAASPKISLPNGLNPSSTPSRFAPPKFCGPKESVAPVFVLSKSFTPPRDLAVKTTPLQPIEPKKDQLISSPDITTVLKSSPLPLFAPTVIKDTPVTNITEINSATSIEPTSPVKTAMPFISETKKDQGSVDAKLSVPVLATSPESATKVFIDDVEMDIDAEPPTSTASMPVLSSITTPVVSSFVTSTTPMATVTPLIAVPPLVSAGTPTTQPLVTQSRPELTSPATPVASQPLFMPSPSFATPTFSSPVIPTVPTMNSMSMPNGSNPFQPTSSTRGRKILRPARRLHR